MKNLKYFFSFYKPHMKLFIFDLFCALIVAVCNLFMPAITQNIINIYVPNKDFQLIFIWAGVLLGIYLIKMFLNYCLQYWGHIVGVRIQADMRGMLFRKLEKLPYTYYDNNKTGTIMSRIINDLMEISELAHHGPEDLFLSLITFIGAFIMIARMNIYLSMIIFIALPFIIIFAVYRKNKQRNAFKQMRIRTGEINAQVESSIAGIRVSRAYTANEQEIKKFDESSKEFQKARAGAYHQMGVFNSGMNFLNDVLYLIALVSGGIFFINGEIDAGQFTGYILYISALINPIRTLVAIFEQIQSGMTGFERFVEVMNEKEEEEVENPKELLGIKNSIEYQNVSFSYGDDEGKYVIKDFSLKIEKGKTIALVGPSGGGKTTLCHLLPRFYEIDEGKITIDGIDIREFSRFSLRKNIGMVAQDVFLFAGTIKENIAYGDFSASDEEIIEAAKKANIHDFILTLEKGYDTYVGERRSKAKNFYCQSFFKKS